MAQGWSSLPVDIVNRVAGCLLAPNDLDYYMDMRAVCHNWRSATADPRSNQHDRCFRPTRWVMLDEHKFSSSRDDDATRLFVNVATGRFLRKSLPLLRHYDFVATTTGGLLVLAARDSTPTHAARVLNPFTGSVARFAAPVPAEPHRLTTEVVVLASAASNKVYCADPSSLSFSVETRYQMCPASRLPQIAAGVTIAGAVSRDTGSEANRSFDRLMSEQRCRCYVVEVAGGDLLAVLKRRRGTGGIDVFKIDAVGNVMERVTSIGSVALFLGIRCVAVDASSIPSIEANCAYYQQALVSPGGPVLERHIYKFGIGIEVEEPELVSATMDNDTVWGISWPPFTLTQLLSNYTMDVPSHLLARDWCDTFRSFTTNDNSEVGCHFRTYMDYCFHYE